jgi:uncharacterized protein (TIGR02284 family)
MAMPKEQVVSTLNNLIQTCFDAEEGFRLAAQGVDKLHLRTLFYEYSQQRAQLAEELRAEVRRQGGTPATGGSLGGALHRGWISVKEAIVGKDDSTIVAECEHGEDVAVEHYQNALEEDLPMDVQQLVVRQFQVVKATHDRVRQLELAYSEAT